MPSTGSRRPESWRAGWSLARTASRTVGRPGRGSSNRGTQLVAGLVRAVLGELDGEPAKRRTVDPAEKALHHPLRHDLDPAKASHLCGVQEIDALYVGHGLAEANEQPNVPGRGHAAAGDLRQSAVEHQALYSLSTFALQRRVGMQPAPTGAATEAPMLNAIWLLSVVTAQTASLSIRPAYVDYRPRVEAWTDRGDSP